MTTLQCGSVVICRSSPAQKAAVVRMMMEYEMSQAEGGSKGLLKWYRRQMKKQVSDPFPPLLIDVQMEVCLHPAMICH